MEMKMENYGDVDIDSSQYARRGAGFGGDVISRIYVAITLTKLYRFYTGCIRE